MHTYDYDGSFSPSIPVVEVAIRNIADQQKAISLTAMVDSGADGTMAPLASLQAIQAQRTGQVILRSVTGARSMVDVYEVTLQIGPHRFPYVQIAADSHNEMMILGRDVLNQLIVTLNGLAATTEVHA